MGNVRTHHTALSNTQTPICASRDFYATRERRARGRVSVSADSSAKVVRAEELLWSELQRAIME